MKSREYIFWVYFNSLRPNEYMCVSKLNIIDRDYLNQCWNIVNSKLSDKHQWNIKQNSCIFIHENAFENVVCEMAAIFSRPQCVNHSLSLYIANWWWIMNLQHLILKMKKKHDPNKPSLNTHDVLNDSTHTGKTSHHTWLGTDPKWKYPQNIVWKQRRKLETMGLLSNIQYPQCVQMSTRFKFKLQNNPVSIICNFC